MSPLLFSAPPARTAAARRLPLPFLQHGLRRCCQALLPGVLAALLLSSCSLLEPIQKARIDVALARVNPADGALEQLAERNRSLRELETHLAMRAPARPDSGLIGEVDVTQLVEKNAQISANAPGEPARRVRLDFENVSLRDVIAAFISDYIKAPYSFSDSYQDRPINLVFDAVATRSEIIALFDSLLAANGVRIERRGTLYLISSAHAPKDPKPEAGGAGAAGMQGGLGQASGLFKLSYLDGKEFINLAKQVVDSPEALTLLPGNVLLARTHQGEMRALDGLIKEVDVPSFLGKHILVYVPRYLSAASLLAILESYQNQLVAGAASNTKQFEVKQVPDMERLVLVAANRLARDLVVQFLAQADVAKGNVRQIFHYPLAMQTATELHPTC